MNPLFGPMDPDALSRLAMMSGGVPPLRGVPGPQGQGATPATQNPMPEVAEQPDRGLGATLFPAPEAQGFLSPEEMKQLRSLSLMRMGAKFLEGSQGPQGTLNVGRTMGEALDQGPFQESISRLMQQRQWQMQYGGYEALRKALSANPPQAGESPLEAADRYRSAADYVMKNAPGPMGLQLSKQLTDLAEGFKRSLPDVEKVENVPGDPNGQYAGQNVVQIRDKQTGQLKYEYPYRMNITPEQRSHMEVELHNAYDQHMAPLNMAKVAADGYKSLAGRSDPAADMLRLQYAKAILGAKGGGEINPQEGMLLDQIMEALGKAPHQLSAESRATIDAQVMAAIPMIRQLANTEHTWTTSRATSYGIDTAGYDNLWLPKPRAPAKPAAPRGGRNTKIIEGT